jgi:hypothetical protein
MARSTATNFSAAGMAFTLATARTDAFVYTDVTVLAAAVDGHDHSSTKGLGVKRLQTGSTPTLAGEVQVTGDSLKWWGATAGAVRTACDLESTQTVAGAKTFSGAVSFTSTFAISGPGSFGGTLTVSVGGMAVTGNSTVTGTLTGLTGLTVASGSTDVSASAVKLVGSQAAGDLLYGASATALARLAIGVANRVLTSSGAAPQWSATLTSVALASPALSGTVTGTPTWASIQAMDISGNAATASAVNAANLTGGTLAAGVTASSLQSFGLVTLTNYIRVTSGALISAIDHVTVPRVAGNYNQIFNKLDGVGSFIFRRVTNVEDTATGATNLMTIDNNGNVLAATFTPSDEALKANFEPLIASGRVVDAIAALKPRRYERTDLGGKVEIGVVAQDVARLFPELVIDVQHLPGRPAEDEPSRTYKAVNYAGLTVPLLAAVLELREELRGLRAAKP